ncbi:hypothetical protein chiPu_0025381, partial [Chiloscyllium punctatum]|nr:hypothetical protein [Chiloscyllium punctatum]
MGQRTTGTHVRRQDVTREQLAVPLDVEVPVFDPHQVIEGELQ